MLVHTYMHKSEFFQVILTKPPNVFDDNNLESLFTAYLLFITNDVPVNRQYRAGEEN